MKHSQITPDTEILSSLFPYYLCVGGCVLSGGGGGVVLAVFLFIEKVEQYYLLSKGLFY